MINQDYLQHDAEILCGAHDGNLVTMDEGHGGQKNEKIKVKFPWIASVPSNHLSDGLVNTGIQWLHAFTQNRWDFANYSLKTKSKSKSFKFTRLGYEKKYKSVS